MRFTGIVDDFDKKYGGLSGMKLWPVLAVVAISLGWSQPSPAQTQTPPAAPSNMAIRVTKPARPTRP